ncbi:MAG: glycosyltransferase [Bacteroidetes bacterium]|nr:glycosyltransferase [Bacteroidota bacterium]
MTQTARPESQIIVLLAHYNDNERLKKALLSVKETIPVDILLVDDGSMIKPNQEELQSIYSAGKLIVELLEKNVGSEKARNHGLSIISKLPYKYIAAMDSDDLNKENRFSKQFNYLENHPEVKLLGSWCDCVDSEGRFLYTLKYPQHDHDIRKKMYINSMFAHATLFFNSEVLKTVGFYPEENKWAEDYAFAFKIMQKYKVENYPEALIYYTINEKGISSTRRRGQVISRLRIIMDNFYFGFYPIYGIIRNIPLIFISRGLLDSIKQLLKKH